MKTIKLLLVSSLLTGCAYNYQALEQLTDEQLCDVGPVGRIIPEIEKRELVTTKQWNAAVHGNLMIGMPPCAVRLAWRSPTVINESVYQWGTTEQWVYRGYGSSPSKYVFFENGRVTGWDKPK